MAISAVSPGDIWAVGHYTSTGQYRTLTQHWDGTQWSIIPSPDPGYNNFLHGVAAISANDVWAVGSYSFPTYGGQHLLTLHWDGTQWSSVANPDPGGNYTNFLSAVDAVSTGDVWAVGFWRRYSPQPLVMRWNGSAWVQFANPSNGSIDALNAVTAISSNDVWALQYSSNGSSLTWHWDGTQWSAVASPNVGVLYDLDASASNDIWAISSSDILHWDGTQWSVVSAPDVGPLNGISALSANDAWVVARDGTLHWDGTQWSVVPGPGVGVLGAVKALAPQDVWAIGTYLEGDVARTLIAHYSTCATNSATPTPPAASTSTATTTSLASATSTPGTDTVVALTALVSTATPTITSTASPTVTTCAVAFSDLAEDSTFFAPIRCLACVGIISGYSDGTFRPNNPVTRGQLAKIVSNAAGFAEDPGPQIFEDVAPGSAFYQWINRLTTRGYMGGYPCGGPGEPCHEGNRPYFRPAAHATRAQTSKIVSNTAQYDETPTEQTFEDVPPSHPFYTEIQRLAARAIMGGYDCGGPGEPCTSGKPYFRPYNDVTRGQSVKIVANTFLPGCNPSRP
jgi:hypothetical protein